jgi:hypothetical protein
MKKVFLAVIMATMMTGCATMNSASSSSSGYDLAHAVAGQLGQQVLFFGGIFSGYSEPEMVCKNCEIADAKAKAEAEAKAKTESDNQSN